MRDYPELAHDLPLIVDSFAGGGGASTGIEAALGRSPDVAINHSAAALALHAANHPDTLHLDSNIWDVEPRAVAAGRRVGLLWASPDCFPAGTLVLTRDGYRPIETIREGDIVLTHKGRWRPVTALMAGEKETVTIRAQGHPGLSCSDGHKFWVRAGKRGEPDWSRADTLGRGSYLATPRVVEATPLPELPGEAGASGFWWIVGRYLADGWADVRRGLVLTVGAAKAGEAAAVLERSGMKWTCRQTATAVRFIAYSAGLCRWLHMHFGHLAGGKRLPGWALCLPRDERAELLAGYVAGDGYRHDGLTESSTGSAALAYGLRSLCETLGHTCRVYRGANPETEIAGRRIRANLPMFKLRWRETVDMAHRQTVEDDLHRWYPVRSVAPAGRQTVYNITVAEDHSYVVEGIVAKNCKHFSKAKGGAPRDRNIRDLAWVIVRWAEDVAPDVIIMENVEEFVTWGPVGEDGQPLDWLRGHTFAEWKRRLRRAGYRIAHRELRGSDYGAPTIRKRFFLIARRAGRPVVWPRPTHGDPRSPAVRSGRLLPWRTAAECIDWSLPCASIFASSAEIMEQHGLRAVRPLARNTLARVARGVARYVLEAAEPYLVSIAHGDSGGRREYSLAEPLGTVSAGGVQHALVVPSVVGCGGRAGQSRPRGGDKPFATITAKADACIATAMLAPVLTYAQQGGAARDPLDPMHTICASSKDQNQVLACSLVQTGYGEREGQAPRALDIGAPLGTVVAGGVKHAAVAAWICQQNTGLTGHDARAPLSTIVGKGCTQMPVAAFFAKYYGTGDGSRSDEPLHTVTVRDRMAHVQAGLCAPPFEPEHEARARQVAEFLREHGVWDGGEFVTLVIDAAEFVIVDIGMRMLTPRELYRAQGFPDDYVIDGVWREDAAGEWHWRPFPKDVQVSCVGNSVCPPLAEALVRANCCHLAVGAEEAVA